MATSKVRGRGASLRPGVEPLERRVVPASLLVTSVADSGAGTLREAIERANLDPDADTIEFAPAVAGEIALASALPDLSTDVAIRGPGASTLAVARQSATAGTPRFRVFTVAAGATVEVSGLTISGGRAESGAGLSNAGTLVISNATITGNEAVGQDAINTGTAGGPGTGGGIFNSGTLTVRDSAISRNGAYGGAALFFGGGYGGGIANSGTLTVVNSALIGNGAAGGAGYGGGISNQGTATVTNATFSGNGASFSGRYGGQGFGGGIYNAGALAVAASTFTGNNVGGRFTRGVGGGIANGPDATRLEIGSTIVAENPGGNLADEQGRVTSLGRNLFSDIPNVPLDPTDLLNTAALLAPLADNGGPTPTHALLPGSPAIDAGAAAPGNATDQRGVARPQGAAPDIGAFESRGFAIATAAGNLQSAFAGTALGAPLAVVVSSPFGEPVEGGRVAFAAPAAGASADLGVGLAPIDASGRAEIRVVANGVPGAYAVSANAAGAPGVAFALTNVAIPVDAAGPVVVAFRRATPRRGPTRLTLAFSEPLDPTRAGNIANYQLVDVGRDGRPGTRDDRRIKVRAATYDPASAAVILTVARLSPQRAYRLTVIATPPGGVADVSGNPLDGALNGRPGDYAVRFRGPRPA